MELEALKVNCNAMVAQRWQNDQHCIEQAKVATKFDHVYANFSVCEANDKDGEVMAGAMVPQRTPPRRHVERTENIACNSVEKHAKEATCEKHVKDMANMSVERHAKALDAAQAK